ncbi:MAG: N-acetyl-gamma-glutamyl-phosphate reductase [Lachnospiraceae bacterium]|nr:N-acetyl-gamma-glutamyl-phosphate reductase [Lachnospiraceae bacterium]
MKPKIYIDGQSGTTGLQIYDRIEARDDLELILIDPDMRHDEDERRKFINAADIVFLCLPDAEAVHAVSLVDNDHVKIIDASTAHRTAEGWTYGFPELKKGQRDEITASHRIANPGCHATGFISTVAPLVQADILPVDYPVSFFSLTGYSGGGKKMIADYEADGRSELLSSPGIYGRALKHKHIPEMVKYTGLSHAPVFLPVVDDYYKGMAGTLTLQNRLLNGTPSAQDIWQSYKDHYESEAFVTVADFEEKPGTIYANELAGSNQLKIYVSGDSENTAVTAIFDNLGKGASGAAVQNMNIALGLDETTGLV